MKFDVIVIGGDECALQTGMQALSDGLSCAIVVFGRPLDGSIDFSAFSSSGGYLVSGEGTPRTVIKKGVVRRLYVEFARNTSFEADRYVLATGGFYSGGLVSELEDIIEPVFGLDVYYEKDRSKWFCEDFFNHQPFMDFGVVTDSEGHPYKDGISVRNLFATGDVVSKQGVPAV